MTEEKTIVCTRCGAKVKTTGSGDFTTFVCENCQEKANLPAYKQEIKDIDAIQSKREENKEERLEKLDERKKFLEAKIEKLEPKE